MAEDLKIIKEELTPKIALGVAAHPDDLEYGIAGTVAKWVSRGTVVYYLILTNGNKGSADRSQTPDQLRDARRQEQRAAAKVLGVKEVFFCDYDDGMLSVSAEVKKDIVRVIRKVKPEVVLTMDPTVVYSIARGFINHTDHRAAGQSTIDAVFPLARDHLSFPELLSEEGLEPHKVSTLLLTNFDRHNFYVDISEVLDTKLKALEQHSTQIPNMAEAEKWVRLMAERIGQGAGLAAAEAFMRLDIERR
jgi:LmbE family N-acetylglucosaminyl deacetylase